MSFTPKPFGLVVDRITVHSQRAFFKQYQLWERNEIVLVYNYLEDRLNEVISELEPQLLRPVLKAAIKKFPSTQCENFGSRGGWPQWKDLPETPFTRTECFRDDVLTWCSIAVRQPEDEDPGWYAIPREHVGLGLCFVNSCLKADAPRRRHFMLSAYYHLRQQANSLDRVQDEHFGALDEIFFFEWPSEEPARDDIGISSFGMGLLQSLSDYNHRHTLEQLSVAFWDKSHFSVAEELIDDLEVTPSYTCEQHDVGNLEAIDFFKYSDEELHKWLRNSITFHEPFLCEEADKWIKRSL